MSRDPGAARRPSMADVGRLANVSAQTVSRYFTGVGYVRADTRERIAAAIDELGYRPNQSARGLRVRRTDTVGVLSMGALNFGSAGVLTGLSAAARRARYTLTVAQFDLDFEADEWQAEAERALDHFLSIPVDGIVVATPVVGSEAIVTRVEDQAPVVVVSERSWGHGPFAHTDSYGAARMATEHLIGLDHRRILHVAGPRTRNEANARERGYLDAMADADLTPFVLSSATDWTAASGHRAGTSAEAGTFTAVFASNDELALGFMSALEERGLRAPGDYSIVGVDDMPSAAYFSPPLTSIRLDFEVLGEAAFRALHDEVQTGIRAEEIIIAPELVIRSSTARR